MINSDILLVEDVIKGSLIICKGDDLNRTRCYSLNIITCIAAAFIPYKGSDHQYHPPAQPPPPNKTLGFLLGVFLFKILLKPPPLPDRKKCSMYYQLVRAQRIL